MECHSQERPMAKSIKEHSVGRATILDVVDKHTGAKYVCRVHVYYSAFLNMSITESEKNKAELDQVSDHS